MLLLVSGLSGILISINMSVVSFFSFLALKTIPLIDFFSTWKFIDCDHTLRIEKGAHDKSHILYGLELTLEPPGLMWQVCFVDWSCQQNALEDNKTLEERMVCTWDDGSVTCKVDSINFGHQNHRRNNSPSLMSLALSYEIAGPATRLSSIEATENVIYTGGSNLLTNGTERSAGKG